LVMSMFKLNPKERKSASELLSHPFFTEAPLPVHPTLLPAVNGVDCFTQTVARQQRPYRPKPIIRRFSPSSRSSSPSSPRHVTFDLPIRTVFFDKEEAPITVCVAQVQLSPPSTQSKKRSREVVESEADWSFEDDEEENAMSVDNQLSSYANRSWARPSPKRPKLHEDLLDSSSSTQSVASPLSPVTTPPPGAFSPIVSPHFTSVVPTHYPGAAANPYLAPTRVVRASSTAMHPTPRAEVIPVQFTEVTM